MHFPTLVHLVESSNLAFCSLFRRFKVIFDTVAVRSSNLLVPTISLNHLARRCRLGRLQMAPLSAEPGRGGEDVHTSSKPTSGQWHLSVSVLKVGRSRSDESLCYYNLMGSFPRGTPKRFDNAG